MNSKTEFTNAKDSSRGISADMSAEAISKRFEILVELNELCAALSKAKPLPDAQADPAEYSVDDQLDSSATR